MKPKTAETWHVPTVGDVDDFIDCNLRHLHLDTPSKRQWLEEEWYYVRASIIRDIGASKNHDIAAERVGWYFCGNVRPAEMVRYLTDSFNKLWETVWKTERQRRKTRNSCCFIRGYG